MEDSEISLDASLDEFDYDHSMDLEDAFDSTQNQNTPTQKKKRQLNYTDVEDIALLNAWEKVSLDPVIGNDQTGSNYWQRIEDLFHRFMPQPSNRTLRSLQGRYDVIKKCCSRWSGCLEQVRNAPPSGCTIDDYVSYLFMSSSLPFFLVNMCPMNVLKLVLL